MSDADYAANRRRYLLGVTLIAIGDVVVLPRAVRLAVDDALAAVQRENPRSPMVVADCGNHRRGPCAMGHGVLCRPCREALEDREVPARAVAALFRLGAR